jgi:TonB family protein
LKVNTKGKAMKILRVSVLMSLALVVGAQAWAQSQASAPLSNRERIQLCKKKRHVPLEPAESQPLKIDETEGKVSRPTIIYQVPPRPIASRGKVVVEAVIDEDGCVRQAKVVQSATAERALDVAAVNAIEQWVFLPATLEGRPVRVFYALTVNTETR